MVFAVSATPLLAIAENLVSPEGWRVLQDLPEIIAALFSGARRSFWIAGTTSFELTYGFGLALVTGFVLYRRFRNYELRLVALERAWSEARLGALRAQLSPHTLFNLLHTIRGQIAWDPAAAQSMIVQLGDLLRGLLAAGEREFSLLRQELQFARVYLQLQQRRFADRVKLSLPEIETLPSVWVPSLILQPLVENAIVHGLTGHDGEVSIQLEAAIENEVLVLRLTNSIAAQRSGDREGATGSGIGLRNVRERLAVHFGDRRQFTAGLDEAQRWRAEMRLPVLPVESPQR
jgi:sensor histidine kinase YesM